MTIEDPSKTNAVKFAAQTFTVGQKLAGCYTLQRKIEQPASEGLIVAWLARDEELQKDIALYFVPDSVMGDSRAMSELRQEVKRNRQMIHPHILRVHDLIEEPEWAAISMDYVEGESVAALLQKKQRKVFDASEIKRWVAELCQTVEDAHKIDLLHRDLSPENLIVAKSGSLILANFGITRCVLDSLSRSGQKIHGDGNLAYMSPQQLDGERALKSDDIYSLGAVLYELLTGKPPFYTGELVSQIRKAIPPQVAVRRGELGHGGEQIPENWENTIGACLKKQADLRPKSAAEALAKLAIEKNAAPMAAAASMLPEAEIFKPQPTPKRSDATKLAQGSKPYVAQRPAIPAEATIISKSPVSAPPELVHIPAASAKKPAETPKQTPYVKSVESGKATEQKKTEVQKPAETAKSEPQKPLDIKKGATTPSGFPLAAFVEVENGKGAGHQKSKFPMAGVAAAIVLIGIGIVGYIMNNDSQAEHKNVAFTPPVASSDPQITTAKNQSTISPIANIGKAAPATSVAENGRTENNGGTQKSTKKTEPIILAQAATPTPAALAPAPVVKPEAMPRDASAKIAQAQQIVAEKARAAEQARQALAVAEKSMQEKASAQQQAQTAIEEAQSAANQKIAAAAAAQKAADDAVNTQKAKAEAQKKAEAEAEDAQKAAAEKARLAVEARKAAEATVQLAKDQQAQQQRAAAEAQELQKAVVEKQRIATDAAKAAADAGTARQQHAQALKLAETEAAQAQITAQKIAAADAARKAAEQAEAIRLSRAKDRERLEQQAAAASKAAAEAQRLAEAARKASEDAEKMGKESELAQQKAEAAAQDLASKAAASVPLESTTLMPSPDIAPIATVVQPHVQNPKSKVDKTLENGLGMKFAPVGDVLFSIWQTRVQDFEAFVKATGYKSETWHRAEFRQDPDHPVVWVNWNDAIAFCKWLTEKEQKEGLLAQNQSYRLPTDLEWSKAVGLSEETGRTPEGRDMDVPDIYPWGTDWPPSQGAGNYTGEETGSDVAIKNYNDGYAWTAPVGSFKPNKFGLYDMGGNVSQWCMDWWNDDHKARVLRGASWYSGALKLSLLSSCRFHAAPDNSTDNFGFRVVIATGGSKK